MQLILLTGAGGKPRSCTLSATAAVFAGGLVLAAIITIAVVLTQWVVERTPTQPAASAEGPQDLPPPQPAQAAVAENPEHLAGLQRQVADLQSRLGRLDSLGDRLATMAGVKAKEPAAAPSAAAKPGRGGPLVPISVASPGLRALIDELTERVGEQEEQFDQIEAELNQPQGRRAMFPSGWPIGEASVASGFGSRRDPFTRRWARHEGLDFSADSGTPILAAAGGVVTAAERHSHYGNMVEIDHGNGLTTRYAHASKLLVQEGTAVAQGEQVALVGSTGRSTGPHLHFEVRKDGVAQNPMRFLRGNQSLTQR